MNFRATQTDRVLRARIGPYDMVVEVDGGLSIRSDCDGRWIFFRQNETFYRRTMNGRVVLNRRAEGSPTDVADPSAIHDMVCGASQQLHRLVRTGRSKIELTGACASPRILMERTEMITAWDAADYEEERRRFERAYPEPVHVLPPDRYNDLVIQPARGCPFAQCEFCNFYKNREYRVLTPKDFKQHLCAVSELFGDAMHLRTGVFIGAANALAIPQARLLSIMESIAAVVSDTPRKMAAFWDPDHSPERDSDDWKALHRAGLQRVFPGLESGDPETRQALGKGGDLGAFVRRLRLVQDGGVGLGVTVLAGPGGTENASRHRKATAKVVRSLQLRPSDLLYISPLSGSMSRADLRRETDGLIAALRDVTPAKVAPYRIEKFRYFA